MANIKTRIKELETKAREAGGVCIIEQDGRILFNGREITREKYEQLKRGSKTIITIVDDIEEASE